jgi:hypothetical protein
MKINYATQDKALRLLLRWIMPIIPLPEIFDLLGDIRRSQEDIDLQVEEAITSIQKTSTLVSRLEESLKERATKLEHLQNEHQRYSKLAEIEASKAESLLREIESTLGKNAGQERWIAFGINIVAGLILFVLGLLLSGPLQRLLSPPSSSADQQHIRR